jgi:hypothetical protein
MLSPSKGGAYRPVRTITYALDYKLSELNPIGYHLSNIVYHLATSSLVLVIILSLTGRFRVALLASLIFVAHPVHTESVAYISGRRDLLCALFYLAGFFSFTWYRRKGKSLFLLLSLCSYLLALGSKEMAVTLPAIFLLYDSTARLEGTTSSSPGAFVRATWKACTTYPLFYLSFFSLAVAFTVYKVFFSNPSQQTLYYGDSIASHTLTMVRVVFHYVKLLFFPVRLSADYSYAAFPLSHSPLEGSVLISLAILALIFYGLLKSLARTRWVAFGGLWFFITLLPVCQIFPHHELMAEHHLYLPSFGFSLALAVIIEDAFLSRRTAPLALPALRASLRGTRTGRMSSPCGRRQCEPIQSVRGLSITWGPSTTSGVEMRRAWGWSRKRST